MRKKKILPFMIAFTTAVTPLSAAFTVCAEETDAEIYEYENKYLWYKETDKFSWTDAKTFAEHNASGINGFDIDEYINTPLAEGVIDNMVNYLTYDDQMDPAVISYWEELGIKKELHDADDEIRFWASYVPLEAFDEDNTEVYPVVFCFPGGDNPIFLAEAYGFAEYGAGRYITIIPDADNCNIVVEEVERILSVIKEEYPVDESRIYCTGFSKGGLASYNVAVSMPTAIAAIAPGGRLFGAQFDLPNGSSLTDEQIETISALGGMPVCAFGGTKESTVSAGGVWTDENRIAGYNSWCKANNCVTEELTLDIVTELSENSTDEFYKTTGANVTDTEVITLDTDYYIGNVYNEDGMNVMQILLEGGQNHWPTGDVASLVWDFFSQYSRDLETGELVYNNL